MYRAAICRTAVYKQYRVTYRGFLYRGLFDGVVRATTPAARALLANIPNLAELSYVKRVSAAVSREDAVDLEACLSMDPRAIPGGQRLMDSGLSDVRGIGFAAT